MDLRLEQLEPTTSARLIEATVELRRRLDTEADPERPPIPFDAFRADLEVHPIFCRYSIVALDDDRPVGLARIWLNRLTTNRHRSEVDIRVDRDHRRRGVGRRLLADLLDRSEADGRTDLIGGGVDTSSMAGFWESFGARSGIEERVSRLRMAATDAELMKRWVDQRRDRAADYELVFWRGSCPEEHLEHHAALMTAMNDAPLEDLDWDPDLWRPTDMRALEEYVAMRGSDRWHLIALDPTGAPAGLTEVTIDTRDPSFSHQGNTVVVGAHRNRGIGRWLKAEMWQRLRRDAPAVEALDTDNAGSNDPMLAINEAMGFRPLHSLRWWQSDIAALRSAIDGRPAPDEAHRG